MTTYDVKVWDSLTGRMELLTQTDDKEEVTRLVRQVRDEGRMPFVYDETGRSVHISRGGFPMR